MTLTQTKMIPFKLELSRMLELLADQIYQSPLALLRENAQNAFDAIRQRQAIPNQEFDPVIHVYVDGTTVVVSDNGIGMTADEIETHFWHAGRSGKNTSSARAAGVVGTFGIGAMANFGVATELSVESESANKDERTESWVRREELSTDADSISLASKKPRGEPGTTVKALIPPESSISADEARSFLREFVEFLDIPVLFNNENISGADPASALPSVKSAWSERLQGASLAGFASGDLELRGMASGELRVVLENVVSQRGLGQPGWVALQQDRNAIRTLRSGFGLATVGLPSHYRWGGVADLPFLRPTAGREALDSSSTQILHQVLSAVDHLVSSLAGEHIESFRNEGFLRWIVRTQQYHLCGPIEITPRPYQQAEPLATAVERAGLRYYEGIESSVVQTYASEDEPLIVLSRGRTRRKCERGYLAHRGVPKVDTSPRVDRELTANDLSFAHSAVSTRIGRILEEDYFLEPDVRFGEITNGLPVLVTDTSGPIVIFLDPRSSSVAPLLASYRDDFAAFGPLVKDFIRATVFPRVSDLVPSSTRGGSEAFLRHLRTNREWFEYAFDDKASLEEVFEDLRAGRVTFEEAKERLWNRNRSFVEVSSGGKASLSSVVGEPPSAPSDPTAAAPSIDRREQDTDALILTSETTVNGYQCFLALSDKVQRGEKSRFFLEPHSTDIVWGGSKVMFVFQHHSKRFGLYYDILCPELVASGSSGGGPQPTATILTRRRTFIPIPSELAGDFVPGADERKRLEVRCDLLYLSEK